MQACIQEFERSGVQTNATIRAIRQGGGSYAVADLEWKCIPWKCM